MTLQKCDTAELWPPNFDMWISDLISDLFDTPLSAHKVEQINVGLILDLFGWDS